MTFIFEIKFELKKYLNWHTFHSVLKWHYIRKYMSLIRRFFTTGHLIQFRGDQAFQDLNVDLLGYFYNCQFPNVVYKAISCYKCRGSSGQHASLVCSLGQAVSICKPCIFVIFFQCCLWSHYYPRATCCGGDIATLLWFLPSIRQCVPHALTFWTR